MSAYPYPAAATRDPTAVVGRRVVAAIVDGVVIGAPTTALAMAQLDLQYLDEADLGVAPGEFCDLFSEQDSTSVCASYGDRVYFSDNVTPLPSVVGLLLSLLVLVVFQGVTGRTPGKAFLGLRTVGEDGRPPGLGKAFLRWLLGIVDGLCFGLLGLIVALSSNGHRRVGDMAAKTFVISKADAGEPVVVPGMAPPPTATGGYGAPGAAGQGWGTPPASSADAWGTPASPPSSSDAWGAAPTSPPGAPRSGERPVPSGDWSQPSGEQAPPRGEVPSPFAAPGSSLETEPASPSGPPAASPAPAPVDRAPEPEPDPDATVVTGSSRAPDPDATLVERGAERDADATMVAPGAGAAADAAPSAGGASGESAPAQYNPQWDAARGTYIVWEPGRGKWLGWDDAAKEWKPL